MSGKRSYAPRRFDATCDKLRSVLAAGPARASWVIERMRAQGFTRDQVVKARPSVASTYGVGRTCTWRLYDSEVPHPSELQTLAEFRKTMGLDKPRVVPKRRPLLRCRVCGCHIGDRADHEDRLCLKDSCREMGGRRAA